MEISVGNQLYLCMLALALGLCGGVLYDLLRCATARVPGKVPRGLLTLASDIVYCLLCGGAFFAMALGPGGGQLRFFLLLFIVPAGAVYFLLLSKPVSWLLDKLLDLLGFIIHYLVLPVKFGAKTGKKVNIKAKNLLRYERKWYTIERSYAVSIPKRQKSAKEVQANENETKPH
ncbi:MAG: hypothetical protein LBM98_05735 [Oscillospiraceae bacterium]|jgi:hypothetical protein|nr:hypothetical protein [Oscillospiraceae bacterium]